MPNRLLGIQFASAELTATGSGLTVAHGLGRTPSKTWIEVTQSNPTATDATSTALITLTDETNITYTVDATSAIVRYIVHAIL